MRTSTPIRATASLMLCGLVIAACGQKPGVRVGDEGLAAGVPDQGQQLSVDAGATAPDEGAVDQSTEGAGGATSDTAGSTDGATGGQGAGTTSGGATGGTTDDGSGNNDGGNNDGGNNSNDGGGGGGGSAQVIGNDRTGAGPEQIVIGLHAPATGAAPLPTTSFELAKDTYWRNVIKNGEGNVLGRENVEVLFADDGYAPETARQKCRELADASFLVVGGGGTDQVQACGAFAKVAQVPYFSAGVTEAGLADNPWYFAASMTYRQQGGLLAQMVAKDPFGTQAPGADGKVGPVLGPDAKIGTIITDTPNFKDALEGWRQGLAANGLTEIDTFQHTKNDDTWIKTTAESFKEQGIDVVYFLSAPTLYLQFVNTADESYNYNPLYIGPGVSKGLNAVLRGGCKAPGKRDDNAVYLSPFPGLDYAAEHFPEFFTASEEFGTPDDDIALALWGLARGQHDLFKDYQAIYGNDLERQTFRAFVEQQAGTVERGVYPAVTFQQGTGGHFGANAAHVLEANCEIKQYETLQEFATGF